MTLLGHRTHIIIPVCIVPPPRGKGFTRSTGTKDSKGQDEERQKTGTIKSPGNEVAVVLEDARAVVAQVELGVEAGDGPA